MFGTMGFSELIIILVIVLIIFGAGKLADNFAGSDLYSTQPTSNASLGVCGGCQFLGDSNDISRFYLVCDRRSHGPNIHFVIAGNYLSGDRSFCSSTSCDHEAIN